jgi:hypothetical protein
MPGWIAWLCLSAVNAELTAPKTIPLFAAEPWYTAAREQERIFEGVLERNPAPGKVGPPTRFNAYRLTWIDGAGKPGGRELYLPGKAQYLAEHLGKRLRATGKPVDVSADGRTYQEIWPARIEVPGETGTTPAPPASVDGVFARCGWQPERGLFREPRLYVFREARHLTPYLKLTGPAVEQAATTLLAKQLRVPAIDWKKQMLVTVAAGLKGQDAERLTITRVEVAGNTMTISYRLEAPAGGARGFGYPAETVLVERFDGSVRLEVDKDERKP